MPTLSYSDQLIASASTGFTGTHTARVYARLNWQSIENNRSSVHVRLVLEGSGSASYYTQFYLCGACLYNSGGNGKWSSSGEVASYDYEIGHNDDGTQSTYISGRAYFGGMKKDTGTFGNTYSLPTIARKSNPTAPSSVNAGSAITITTNRKSTSFTHTLTYNINGNTGTIATGVGANYTWTVPQSLEKYFTTSGSATCTVTCTTYNGSSNIGSNTTSFIIYASTVPALSNFTVTETNPYVTAKGSNVTVQNISSKAISVTASAYNNASIKSVVCNGVTLTGNNGTYTGTLSNLSTGNFQITATDSRGKTSSSGTIQTTYYSYKIPVITASIERVGSETSQEALYSTSVDFTNILSNTITKAIITRVNGDGSTSPEESIKMGIGSERATYSHTYDDMYYTSSYSLTLTITDSFNQTVSLTKRLAMGQYSFAILKNGVMINRTSYIYDSTDNMKSLLDFFHPIGDIVYNVSADFDPNTLWGGTWEKITDKFLVGAGNSYTLGSTGGEATHTLTVDEMPTHKHTVGVEYGTGSNLTSSPDTEWSSSSGGYAQWGNYERTNYPRIKTAGGSKAHNNLPPYKAVYIWQRIS